MATRSGRSGASSRSSTRKPASSRAGAGRADKSVEAFRDALERSVMLSRERLQEVVDDAVRRGRMTRDDANELVSRLVSRGRQYSDDLMRDLERLLEQARRELETRGATARKRATKAAGRVGRAAREAADRPLAQADRLRRRAAPTTGFPITGYDQLTAAQVRSRLSGLTPAQLRAVRDRERRGKARKSILGDIEKRLK